MARAAPERLRVPAGDGAALAMRLWRPEGEPRGRPALLLHSLFFDGSMFDACASALASDRLCFAPDHRGQGDSEGGEPAPTCERLARDAIGLCERLGTGPVHLVGSSMGAYVAMEMLRAGAPALSLAVSCCACEREGDPARFAALAHAIRHAEGRGLADRLMPLMFGDTFLHDPARGPERERWRARFDALPPGTDRTVEAMVAHGAYRDVLRARDGPILAIAGGEDRAKRPADLEWIGVDGIGSFRLYKDCGHSPPVEAPARYAADVAAHLRAAEAAVTSRSGSHALRG